MPGEVEAFCTDLGGRRHINTVVRMSVDKLHDLLFSADTHFIQHLFSQRHFTGEAAYARARALALAHAHAHTHTHIHSVHPP